MTVQAMVAELEVVRSHILDMFRRLCQQILFMDWKSGVRERGESRMANQLMGDIVRL